MTENIWSETETVKVLMNFSYDLEIVKSTIEPFLEIQKTDIETLLNNVKGVDEYGFNHRYKIISWSKVLKKDIPSLFEETPEIIPELEGLVELTKVAPKLIDEFMEEYDTFSTYMVEVKCIEVSALNEVMGKTGYIYHIFTDKIFQKYDRINLETIFKNRAKKISLEDKLTKKFSNFFKSCSLETKRANKIQIETADDLTETLKFYILKLKESYYLN
jgi:hypothetical protein